MGDDVSASNGKHVLNVKEGDDNHKTQTISSSETKQDSTSSCISFPFLQKVRN